MFHVPKFAARPINNMVPLVVLAFALARVEEADLVLTGTDGSAISGESIRSSSSLIARFKAFGKPFELGLRDSSLRIDDIVMRQNLCDFSVDSLGGGECYGSISFCNSIHGSFVSSGTMYQIRSTGPGRVEVQDLGGVLEAPPDEGIDAGSQGSRIVKVFLINDTDRVEEVGPTINLDTIEIFKNAKQVFEGNKWTSPVQLSLSGILNAVNGPLVRDFVDRPMGPGIDTRPFHVEYEKADSIEMLMELSKRFELAEADADVKALLEKSNLVLLLKTSGVRVNGLTFVGGMASPHRRFGIVRVAEPDSYFYKGKVLAHEIAHSLGAGHDHGDGCLMREEENPGEREESAVLSLGSIRDIEDFISRHESMFGEIDTCGNGVMEEGKECDSGLPGGSACCTSRCKLRAWAQCDDRNGRCCKGCALLPKNSVCGERTLNVHKMGCEEGSYCDGVSPVCKTKHIEDGTELSSGGTCRRGVLQTESLMCERVGRFSSPGCSSRNGELWCLDQYDVCLPVLTSLNAPIPFSGGLDARQGASALQIPRSKRLAIAVAIPICLLIMSRLGATAR